MIIETGGKRQFCPLQLSSEQQWTFLFTGFLASTKKISFDKYVRDLRILPYPLHIFRRHCNADRIVRWSILWPAIPIEKDFRVFEKIQRGLKLEKLSFNSICAIFFSNIEKKFKKKKKMQLWNFGVCAFLQVVANHICKSFCTENVRCEKSESSTEATETWYKEKLENNLMCDSQKHCGATLCL